MQRHISLNLVNMTRCKYYNRCSQREVQQMVQIQLKALKKINDCC